MQFNVNSDVARGMAKRLRNSVGAEILTQSRSMEVLAHTLGAPNWDTLSGLLKADAHPQGTTAKVLRVEAPRLLKPVDLYLEARVASDYDQSGAKWARVQLTQALLDLLAAKVNQCREFGDIGVRLMEGVDEWDESESLNHRNGPMAVTQDDFWFTSTPKHASYFVETVRCPLERLFKVLQDGHSELSDFLCTRGALLHASDRAEYLVSTLVDQGRWVPLDDEEDSQ